MTTYTDDKIVAEVGSELSPYEKAVNRTNALLAIIAANTQKV